MARGARWARVSIIATALLLLTSFVPTASAHVQFWPYDAPSTAFTDDNHKREPVNLIFWGKGDAAVVYRHMVTQLGWTNCSKTGSVKYAFVQDNHTSGYQERWEGPFSQVCKGNFFGTRYHIRLYDGYSDPDGFAEWTIGEGHKEVWSWAKYNHVVVSWEEPEQLVKNDFTGRTYVTSIGSLDLGNAGCYGNYDPLPCTDGLAASIQLNS